ncbi:hypothetical protein [Halorhodospira halochloris]|uniref:hypothetical protein n=1 Tax=Halorhodospira halochloris TaxID=1052 RepID=UPI0013A566BE|nr:hypothetical protein [Halorhodospira halochloris]
MEDAVNPSLEASWHHPWRQDLHTEVNLLARGTLKDDRRETIPSIFTSAMPPKRECCLKKGVCLEKAS